VKNKSLPVAVFVAIVGCVLAVSANVTTSKMHEKVKNERFKRLDLEKNILKLTQENNALKKDLAGKSSKLAQIEKIFNVGKAEKDNLKTELQKVVTEKDTLRSKIENLQKDLNEAVDAAKALEKAQVQAQQQVQEMVDPAMP